MSTQEQDIERLEQRLRHAAAELEAQHLPLGEPTEDWRRHLAFLNEREDTRFALLVPTRPRLEELLAYDQDDATFIEAFYHHLLGRESDPEGSAYYLRETAAFGRLFVLSSLLQAAPAQAHIHRQGIHLPPILRRLTRLHAMANRGSGAMNRLQMAAFWRLLRAWDKLKRRRWANTASLYRLLARNSAASQTRQVIANALLEIDQRQQALTERQQHEYARQGSLWQQVAELRRQTLSTPGGGEVGAPHVPAPPTDDDGAPSATALDAYYLAFEDAFRGEETQISDHLERYRDTWTRARQAGRRALDLGCGRGEWLRLLTQAGFEAHGIDLNTTMVAHCQAQGFAVEYQDALAALKHQADNSHALISGFHIAEHLPFEALFQLIAEAHRVLAPGGVLILETPNPENLIVASYSFYHDLTHRNPLTPPTLGFLYQFHGFQAVETRRFNPPPESTRIDAQDPAAERLDRLLMAPMDYAIIGTKDAPHRDTQGDPQRDSQGKESEQ
ncbi:class I SAM-dependent methyltransferase [Halomonas sp. Bachu 37]|uniref:class I SAM-dependent methyltransferase n=1 Tax=Halomonas kashgarensis TaxID=3084920 RepID=UPI003216C710